MAINVGRRPTFQRGNSFTVSLLGRTQARCKCQDVFCHSFVFTIGTDQRQPWLYHRLASLTR